jgi:hypothetical protein
MNFPGQASINDPATIRGLADRMRERGIVPELEIFDMGMLDYALYLIERKVLHEPFYFNFLLGSLGTLSATPLHLALLAEKIPAGATWGATGIGRFQLRVNALAIAMGGHVRVGLEDNLFMDADKTEPATNLALVQRIAALRARWDGLWPRRRKRAGALACDPSPSTHDGSAHAGGVLSWRGPPTPGSNGCWTKRTPSPIRSSLAWTKHRPTTHWRSPAAGLTSSSGSNIRAHRCGRGCWCWTTRAPIGCCRSMKTKAWTRRLRRSCPNCWRTRVIPITGSHASGWWNVGH